MNKLFSAFLFYVFSIPFLFAQFSTEVGDYDYDIDYVEHSLNPHFSTKTELLIGFGVLLMFLWFVDKIPHDMRVFLLIVGCLCAIPLWLFLLKVSLVVIKYGLYLALIGIFVYFIIHAHKEKKHKEYMQKKEEEEKKRKQAQQDNNRRS